MKTTLPPTLHVLLLTAATFLGAHALPGQVLLNEDFQTGQTIGENPTGTSGAAVGNGTSTSNTIVTGAANQAGGGDTGNQGVRLLDDLGSGSGSAVGIEYNFVNSAANQISAFRIDLDFATSATSLTGAGNLVISAGVYNDSTSLTLNSSGLRAFEVRIFPDSTIDFVSSSGPDSQNTPLVPGASNSLSIFVNDFDSQSISYVSPTDSTTMNLAANSIDYYLNNVLILSTTLDSESVGATQWLTTENNFGRMGITTFTNTTEMDMTFDNIMVTSLQIPEPGTGAMVMISLAAVAGTARSRRRRA